MSVRQSRAATDAGAYAHKHRDSPIAKACGDVGPVQVTSTVRADIAHACGRHELARAYGLGVCSVSHGFAPDVHQHASGLWPELSPADYLVRWVETALQWAQTFDDRVGSVDEEEAYDAAKLAQIDQWAAELVAVAPVWYVDWLARLVHLPKRRYLVEIGACHFLGAPRPMPVDAEWADKVRRQWQRRAQGIRQVEHVAKALEVF